MTERVLSWEGCLNVRDLGGHAAANGRVTRFGAVVRADSVRHLTDAGWAALVDYGVRTIVDLRRHDELERDPPLDVPVDVVHVPLETPEDFEIVHATWRGEGDDEARIHAAYVLKTERLAVRFAAAIETVANAAAGGVVVHCLAGKDRTGLTCAMLLRLAGVGIDDIAADYGLSGDNIRSIIDPWAEAAPDEHERALRLRIGASPPQVMADVLAELEQRHGSVRGYLLDAGADADAIDAARDRLLG
jgi:protein tyrosine/serine phosphatase